MIFPLPKSSVTTFSDTYGESRTGGREHHGTDISVPDGTRIFAVESGQIKETGNNSLDGNYIILGGSGGMSYRYSHLSSIAVKEGQTVSQGAFMGLTGHTGNAKSPHLHFGMTDGSGASVNPYPYLKDAYSGPNGSVNVIDASDGEAIKDSKGGFLGLEWSWYDVGATLVGIVAVLIIAHRLIMSQTQGVTA